jgi:hypothetical protein
VLKIRESDFRDNKTSHPFKQVFVNKEKVLDNGEENILFSTQNITIQEQR